MKTGVGAANVVQRDHPLDLILHRDRHRPVDARRHLLELRLDRQQQSDHQLRQVHTSTGQATDLSEVKTQQLVIPGTGSNKTYRYAAIYSWVGPPIGQAGSLTVSFTAAVPSGIVVGAANFAGVNQTTPLGTAVGAPTTAAQAQTATVDATGLNGDELVFDNVFFGGGSSTTLTVGAGQTERWNTSSSTTRAAGSTEPAPGVPGSSVTMSWTTPSTAAYWAIAAVPIKPASTIPRKLTMAVSPDSAGTTTPAVGEHTDYTDGQVVNISATPNPGYLFDHWSDDASGSAHPTTVTMNADKTVTAVFVPAHNLTVDVSPVGRWYDEPDWDPRVSCGTGRCHHSHAQPRLRVQPLDGDASGSTHPITVNMDGDKTVTAVFVQQEYTLTVNYSGQGQGVVILDLPDLLFYHYGDQVTLNAVPASGSEFAGWGGDLADGANPQTVTMNGNKTVTATFEQYVPMPLGVDGTASSGTGAATASSVSFSHTTGTGSDRLMLVGVSWNCGSTNRTISSVTFTPSGGSAINLTEVITQLGYSSSNPRYSAIYRRLNPPKHVAGTVTVTFSGAVSNGIVAGAVNFAGVDQTTPLGTPGGVGSPSNTSTSISVDLNDLHGNELVFDNVFAGAQDAQQALTLGAGQTALWNVLGYSSSSTSTNIIAGASTEQATGSSVTMSWAFSSAAAAITAVPINPLPAAATYDLTVNVVGQRRGRQGSRPGHLPLRRRGRADRDRRPRLDVRRLERRRHRHRQPHDRDHGRRQDGDRDLHAGRVRAHRERRRRAARSPGIPTRPPTTTATRSS